MPIAPSSAESISRRYREAESDSSMSSVPSTRRETPQARRDQLAPDTLAERQPASTDYLAFLAHLSSRPRAVSDAGAAAPIAPLSAEAARDAAVQAKLDGVRAAFSGPYVVEGESVSARPMFRMTTHVVPKKNELEVDARGARAGVNAFPTRMGQGSPKELVKITQALIDAGRLPPGPGDVATRIRQMQWEYGIGVDCAGYSKQALVGCGARSASMYPPGMESFRDLDGKRAGSFAKQPIEGARPGDLITLDGPPGGWGHNVVVYSHVTADDAKKASLAGSDPAMHAFLSSPGPHHVIEVDSSWGAGPDGAEEGGYRRDTWLYDASTKTWGSFEPDSKRFVTSTSGPAHDSYHGTYRPR